MFAVGPKIRQARIDAGLTQESVAEKIGVIPHMVKDYEADRKKPSLDRMPRLASALGKPIGWFFGEDDLSDSEKRLFKFFMLVACENMCWDCGEIQTWLGLPMLHLLNEETISSLTATDLDTICSYIGVPRARIFQVGQHYEEKWPGSKDIENPEDYYRPLIDLLNEGGFNRRNRPKKDTQVYSPPNPILAHLHAAETRAESRHQQLLQAIHQQTEALSHIVARLDQAAKDRLAGQILALDAQGEPYKVLHQLEPSPGQQQQFAARTGKSIKKPKGDK